MKDYVRGQGFASAMTRSSCETSSASLQVDRNCLMIDAAPRRTRRSAAFRVSSEGSERPRVGADSGHQSGACVHKEMIDDQEAGSEEKGVSQEGGVCRTGDPEPAGGVCRRRRMVRATRIRTADDADTAKKKKKNRNTVAEQALIRQNAARRAGLRAGTAPSSIVESQEACAIGWRSAVVRPAFHRIGAAGTRQLRDTKTSRA